MTVIGGVVASRVTVCMRNRWPSGDGVYCCLAMANTTSAIRVLNNVVGLPASIVSPPGNRAVEASIGGLVDLAHTAGTDRGGHLIRAETTTRNERHCGGFYAIRCL
jgi:hypothetical protein